LAWQFSSNKPIYQQIVDAVELRIFSGAYPAGERLPSVRELAETAAVNPNTMQRALTELERKGLVSTQRTTGRTVTTDAAVLLKAREEKASLLAGDYLCQMRALGADPLDAVERAIKTEDKEDKKQDDGSHNS
jgi:GntR family transcriptional regulator